MPGTTFSLEGQPRVNTLQNALAVTECLEVSRIQRPVESYQPTDMPAERKQARQQ